MEEDRLLLAQERERQEEGGEEAGDHRAVGDRGQDNPSSCWVEVRHLPDLAQDHLDQDQREEGELGCSLELQELLVEGGRSCMDPQVGRRVGEGSLGSQAGSQEDSCKEQEDPLADLLADLLVVLDGKEEDRVVQVLVPSLRTLHYSF